MNAQSDPTFGCWCIFEEFDMEAETLYVLPYPWGDTLWQWTKYPYFYLLAGNNQLSRINICVY